MGAEIRYRVYAYSKTQSQRTLQSADLFYEIMLKNSGDTGICQVFFSRPACAVALGKD
jgi:hypothetical protein